MRDIPDSVLDAMLECQDWTPHEILITALAEWERLGMVLVPKEATPAMVKAAHSALYHYREKVLKDPQQDTTNDEKHAIRYRAMIAALEDK